MIDTEAPRKTAFREMVRFFGDDRMGTRAANGLLRGGICSLEELAGMCDLHGEDGVRERLRDLRNIGEGAVDRIFEGLRRYRREGRGSEGETPEGPSPEGLGWRLRQTVSHLTEVDCEEPFPFVKDSWDRPCGLTLADLRTLQRLLRSSGM